MIRNLHLYLLLFIITSLWSPSINAQSGPIPPIDTGYGADGPYGIKTYKYYNPMWTTKPCFLFTPDTAPPPRPTILFGHGYGHNDTTYYKDLIEHVVSRGYNFVFSPYPTSGTNQYDIMFNGYVEALDRYPSYIDSMKIGFVGHSFGGGAVPHMMHRALNEKNWAQKAGFMMMLAPWYVFEITQSELQSYPDHIKLLMQVYEEDEVNDHRMARDIFQMTNIDWSEKDYIKLMTDSNENYTLKADHFTPNSAFGFGTGEVDALDYYGIYRLFDALADYSFNGSNTGKTVALGNGSDVQTYMGQWPDSTKVKELKAGDQPSITKPQSYYDSPCDTFINPRQSYCDTVVTPLVRAQAKEKPSVSVIQYPQPASEAITFELTLSQAAKVTFRWMASNGQVLRQTNLGTKRKGGYQLRIPVRQYRPGLYLYQFQVGTNIEQGKSLIVR